MMSTLAINPSGIAPAQHAFQSVHPVKPGTIRNDADYERVVAFMNSLRDVVGDDEAHELAYLLGLVGQLVEDYEATRHVIPDAAPHEVLRFLLDQHGLKLSDLATEIDGQSVVSDILSGKRAINARQGNALATRFGVSAVAVFCGWFAFFLIAIHPGPAKAIGLLDF